MDPVIHVHAPPGPDVEAFIALIDGFNNRNIDPTSWRLESHIGVKALDTLIAERHGEIVVLADKPWLTDSANLPHLDAITAQGALAVDIMTGRHSALARLRNLIIAAPDLFGALDGGDGPALEFSSTHHLLKTVDGRPLRRPPWFYDSSMQGDGLVDIQSHYVDQAQWILGPDHHFDVDRDVEMLDAKRWSLPVPLEVFRESTGDAAFPDDLTEMVEDGNLHLACNARVGYRMRRVHVRQHCEWGLREAPGGGDVHGFTARGEKAVLTIRNDPETGFRPRMGLRRHDNQDIEPALGKWRATFSALEARPGDEGYLLSLPSRAEVAHEAQFPDMLDQFLDLVEAEVWPDELMARIRARYTLLARARARAGDRALRTWIAGTRAATLGPCRNGHSVCWRRSLPLTSQAIRA